MKKILFMFALILSVMSMNAQTAIEASKPLDNVYVGVNVGGSMPLTMNSVFPLNTNASIRVGKNFDPIFGAFVEGTAEFGDNVGFGHDYCYSHTFVKGSNVGIYGTVNWMNLCCGYKSQPRNFEIVSVAGLGWLHSFGLNDGFTNNKNDLSSKTAVDLIYNFGKNKEWQFVVEPGVFWNLSAKDDIQFNKNFAQLGLSAGINYKFKTSNGTHNFKVYDIKAMNDELNALRSHRCPPQKVREIVQRIADYTPISKTYVVTFAFDSAELNERAKQDLNAIPQNVTVDIEASASPEGNVDHNLKLSQDRADSVKSYLESRGVKVGKADGIGVYDDASGRQATVTIR